MPGHALAQVRTFYLLPHCQSDLGRQARTELYLNACRIMITSQMPLQSGSLSFLWHPNVLAGKACTCPRHTSIPRESSLLLHLS